MSGNIKMRRKYSADDIEKAKMIFASLPIKDNSTTNMTGSSFIQSIAGEIKALQVKGYTLQEIVNILDTNELPIKLPTIKSVLARKKKQKSVSKKANAAVKATTPINRDAQTVTQKGVIQSATAKEASGEGQGDSGITFSSRKSLEKL